MCMKKHGDVESEDLSDSDEYVISFIHSSTTTTTRTSHLTTNFRPNLSRTPKVSDWIRGHKREVDIITKSLLQTPIVENVMFNELVKDFDGVSGYTNFYFFVSCFEFPLILDKATAPSLTFNISITFLKLAHVY